MYFIPLRLCRHIRGCKHIKLRKSILHLARDLRAFFAVDLRLCADHDQKALSKLILTGGIRRSDDPLGTTALYCSPNLFGDRETKPVYKYLFRVFLLQPFRVKILQYVYADISSEKMLSRAIGFIIKMMLFDSGKFHFHTSIEGFFLSFVLLFRQMPVLRVGRTVLFDRP